MSLRRFPPDRRDAVRGPAPAAGFTLIELMIVTVILGMVAMLAFPLYQDVRADAARGALQEQLRTLAQAQRMHFLVNDAYAVDAADLDYRPAERLELELRVGPEGAGPGDAGAPGQAKKGWAARLTDPAHGVRCAVFHGSADPLAPAVTEGVIACDDGG